MKNRLKLTVSQFITALLLTLPCLADDIDNTAALEESIDNTNFWIKAVGIALIIIVVIAIIVKNRSNLFKSPSASGSMAPLDEDKVSDELRLTDPDFKRDDIKALAGKTLLAELDGVARRDAAAIKPFETPALYAIREKMLREYIENKRINHFDDVKLLSVELAALEQKEGDRLTVRASAQMLDYTTDVSGSTVYDGSRLVKRTHAYKMVFVRANNGSPWLLDALTKWGREA